MGIILGWPKFSMTEKTGPSKPNRPNARADRQRTQETKPRAPCARRGEGEKSCAIFPSLLPGLRRPSAGSPATSHSFGRSFSARLASHRWCLLRPPAHPSLLSVYVRPTLTSGDAHLQPNLGLMQKLCAPFPHPGLSLSHMETTSYSVCGVSIFYIQCIVKYYYLKTWICLRSDCQYNWIRD
jgi:hypothetical protein